MPHSDHTLTALAFYYAFLLLPSARWGHSKPRLTPARERIESHLRCPRLCRAVTRLSPAELRALAADLHISAHAAADGNWRLSPLQRLFAFLVCFSNSWPSRKLRLALGWAANSVLDNWRFHIHHIIDVLDAEGSRQSHMAWHTGARSSLCLLVLSACSPPAVCPFVLLTSHRVSLRACLCPCLCCAPADRIEAWTPEEQRQWLAAPAVDAAAFPECIGIVDATYLRVQRPKQNQQERRVYSTYKKHHALFFLAIVDRRGT